MEPLAQGDSCELLPQGQLLHQPAGTRPWGWQTALRGSREGEEQLTVQGVHSSACRVSPTSLELGAEEQGQGSPRAPYRQPWVDSSRRGGGRIPAAAAAPWRGRQRGSIISTVLLGGEGLVPGYPAAILGQRRGEHELGKGIADKGGGGFDTEKGLFFPFIYFFSNSLDNITQHCKWID